MKLRHKDKNHPAKDFGFGRNFNPDKSPHTRIEMKDGRPVVTYVARNRKYEGRTVWAGKGTYIKAKHGLLPHPFKRSKLIKLG